MKKKVRGEWIYFIHKRGGGVARIPAGDSRCVTLYRKDPGWKEVKQATYRDERFKLCLV